MENKGKLIILRYVNIRRISASGSTMSNVSITLRLLSQHWSFLTYGNGCFHKAITLQWGKMYWATLVCYIAEKRRSNPTHLQHEGQTVEGTNHLSQSHTQILITRSGGTISNYRFCRCDPWVCSSGRAQDPPITLIIFNFTSCSKHVYGYEWNILPGGPCNTYIMA